MCSLSIRGDTRCFDYLNIYSLCRAFDSGYLIAHALIFSFAGNGLSFAQDGIRREHCFADIMRVNIKAKNVVVNHLCSLNDTKSAVYIDKLPNHSP